MNPVEGPSRPASIISTVSRQYSNRNSNGSFLLPVFSQSNFSRSSHDIGFTTQVEILSCSDQAMGHELTRIRSRSSRPNSVASFRRSHVDIGICTLQTPPSQRPHFNHLSSESYFISSDDASLALNEVPVSLKFRNKVPFPTMVIGRYDRNVSL